MEFDTDKALAIGLYIASAGIKVGLYVGAVALTYKAVLKAAAVLEERIALPGGEIFTVPLIVGLLWVGWTMRGDVERAWRQVRKELRRRQNARRF